MQSGALAYIIPSSPSALLSCFLLCNDLLALDVLGWKTCDDPDIPTLFELLKDSYPLAPASTIGKVLHIFSLDEAYFENLIGFVQFLSIALSVADLLFEC